MAATAAAVRRKHSNNATATATMSRPISGIAIPSANATNDRRVGVSLVRGLPLPCIGPRGESPGGDRGVGSGPGGRPGIGGGGVCSEPRRGVGSGSGGWPGIGNGVVCSEPHQGVGSGSGG